MKNSFEKRGAVTAIFLIYKGLRLESLIDSSDLQLAASIPGTWRAVWDSDVKTFYCQTHYTPSGEKRTLKLHRLITDCPKGMVVDHTDHDGLDNRRGKLRVVSTSTNCLNKRGARSDSTTKMRWVHYHSRTGHYEASVQIGGIKKYLGVFLTPAEAHAVAAEYFNQQMVEASYEGGA